jgi:hypothetical protein
MTDHYWHTTGFVANPHLGEQTGWLIQDERVPSRGPGSLGDALAYPRRTRVVPAHWNPDTDDEVVSEW